MSDTPQTPSDAAAPLDGLREYLATRDIPCPGCGYNLRGVQDPVCPECGGEVELSVTRAAGGRGWLWLLVLALGWVLLAAGMHTTRSALAARDEARVISGMQVLVSSSFSFSSSGASPVVINRGGFTSPSGAAARSPITVLPSPSRTVSGGSASPVTITTRPGGSLTISGGPAVVTPGRTMAWSQVRIPTWIALGVSSLLAIVAAVLLVFVIVRRRVIVRLGPSRGMVGAALAIFAVYAVGQVVLFARDIAG